MIIKPGYKAFLPALTVLIGTTVTGAAHAGCNPENSYTGEICMTAASYCPAGTQHARGQLLPISQYTELFSILGTAYGGDGETNFALPNLAMRAPVGTGHYDGENSVGGLAALSRGTKIGRVWYAPSLNTLTGHSHDATISWAGDAPNNDRASPAEGETVETAAAPSETEPRTAPQPTVTIGMTGRSNDVNIVGPRLSLTYCVVLDGIYPPRPDDE